MPKVLNSNYKTLLLLVSKFDFYGFLPSATVSPKIDLGDGMVGEVRVITLSR